MGRSDSSLLDDSNAGRQQETRAPDTLDNVYKSSSEGLVTTQRRLRNAQLPAVDVPIEILSQIFKYSCLLPTRNDARMGEFYHKRKIRCAIAATCSHWRRVAIQTTSLWSTITPLSKRTLPPPRDLVLMELQRAAGHPIDFLVGGATQDDAKWVVEILRTNMSRCRSLDVTLSDPHIMDFLMSDAFTSPKSLARLEYFKCKPWYTKYSERASLTEINLTNATSLYDIYYDIPTWRPRDTMEVSMSLPQSQVNQLKRIHVTDFISPTGIKKILPLCLQLESLWFYSGELVDYDLLPTYLPRLKHLHLGSHGAIRELPAIIAPNLERLELYIFEDEDETEREDNEANAPNISGCCDQLARFPNLRHIAICISEKLLPSTILIKFLESHPSLEEICIEFRELDMELVGSLGGNTFRNLRKLSIDLPIRHPARCIDHAMVLLSMRETNLQNNEADLGQLHSLAGVFKLSVHLSRPWRSGYTSPDLPEIEKLCHTFPGVVCLRHSHGQRDEIWRWCDGFGAFDIYE